MASASLILDSDEDNVEFQDRGAKEGAMFQPLAHSDRPRANAQDSLPTWALAKPVGVNLVPDSQMPDSQMPDSQVADSQLWFGDDIPASQPADSQEPADSQDLFGDSDGIGIPDTTEEKEEKNQVLKRKKPFVDDDIPVTPPPRKSRTSMSSVASDRAAAASDECETVNLENPEDIIKAKAAELIDDPKFKKGTVMSSLSPRSQEVLKEIRKIRARDVSNSWHTKWVSKGKPREDGGSDDLPGAEAAHGAGDLLRGEAGDLPGGEAAHDLPGGESGGEAGHGPGDVLEVAPAADAVVDDQASKPLNLMSERVPGSDPIFSDCFGSVCYLSDVSIFA